jgi:hypothetical protein
VVVRYSAVIEGFAVTDAPHWSLATLPLLESTPDAVVVVDDAPEQHVLDSSAAVS